MSREVEEPEVIKVFLPFLEVVLVVDHLHYYLFVCQVSVYYGLVVLHDCLSYRYVFR